MKGVLDQTQIVCGAEKESQRTEISNKGKFSKRNKERAGRDEKKGPGEAKYLKEDGLVFSLMRLICIESWLHEPFDWVIRLKHVKGFLNFRLHVHAERMQAHVFTHLFKLRFDHILRSGA